MNFDVEPYIVLIAAFMSVIPWGSFFGVVGLVVQLVGLIIIIAAVINLKLKH